MTGDDYIDIAPSTFFALVSFLERSAPGATPIGEAGPPRNEAIRFRNSISLGFPSSDVSEKVVLDEASPRYEVTTTFLGLTGAVSPLPNYLLESVLVDARDTGVQRDFLDVFHHRAISLFYRAKVRHEPARQHRSDGSDPWLLRVLGLAGVHTQAGLPLQPRHLMPLLPILANRQRGATALRLALRSILQDELPEAEVAIHEFVGGWLEMDEDEHTLLGTRNHALNRGFMLGRRVHDRRGKFAIRIGKLLRKEARMFSEDQPLLERVRATVSLVLRDPLEYDLELVLHEGEAQSIALGEGRLGESRLSGFTGSETLVRQNAGRGQGKYRAVA